MRSRVYRAVVEVVWDASEPRSSNSQVRKNAKNATDSIGRIPRHRHRHRHLRRLARHAYIPARMSVSVSWNAALSAQNHLRQRLVAEARSVVLRQQPTRTAWQSLAYSPLGSRKPRQIRRRLFTRSARGRPCLQRRGSQPTPK